MGSKAARVEVTCHVLYPRENLSFREPGVDDHWQEAVDGVGH